MRFVHLADLHLGRSFKTASFASGFGKMKREAIGENFQSVIDYCNELHVDVMFIAGDFIDCDYIEMSDMYDIVYRFNKLKNTRVFIIAGNHDPLIKGDSVYEWVEWPDHVTIFDSKVESYDLEDLDTSIIGLSWMDKGPMTCDYEPLKVALKTSSMKQKVLMLHGDIYLDNGYHYMEPKKLLELGADYYALGHIHKPDRVESKLVYPGSLEPLDFKETGDHGFVSGQLVNNQLELEWIYSMKHGLNRIEVDVTGIESYLELVERITTLLDMELEHSMVRLYLTGDMEPGLTDVTGRLLDQLQKSVIYPKGHISYIEIKDNSTPAYDLDILRQNHKDDIIGRFIEEMTKEIEEGDPLAEDALKEGLNLLLGTIK